jgi:hypothetical protein
MVLPGRFGAPVDEDPVLNIIRIALLLLPLAEGAVRQAGGTAGTVKVGLGVIGAVRNVSADLKAAKAATSPGGPTVTVDEAEHVALVFAERVAVATAPLVGIDVTAEDPSALLAWAEAVAAKVVPALYKHFTGKDWPALAPPVAA